MATLNFHHHELGFALAAPTTWTLSCKQPGQTDVTGVLDGNGQAALTLTAGMWARSLSNGTDVLPLTPVLVTSAAVAGGDSGGIVTSPKLQATAGPPVFIERLGSIGSVASNGGSSAPGDCVFIAPAKLQIMSAWKVPQVNEATHGTATTSATYRQHVLVNLGPSGTGTATIGTLNVKASATAFQPQAFTLAANPTVAAGAVLGLNQTTVGGTDNDGTVVQASQVMLAYQLL